jgi:hypothetical protein
MATELDLTEAVEAVLRATEPVLLVGRSIMMPGEFFWQVLGPWYRRIDSGYEATYWEAWHSGNAAREKIRKEHERGE